MALIQKMGFFGAPLLIMAAGSLSAQGCDDPSGDICGECGSLAEGDVEISGSARLDGFFKAVSALDTNATAATEQFAEGLAELEAAYGIEPSGGLSGRVDAVVGAIETDIATNVEGDLIVDYQPARCTANVDVAAEAQANCVAEADCDVSAECEGGEVSVTCEGQCTGTCEGSCDGTAQCTVSGEAAASCSGTCEGSCELEAAAECQGTCRGTCDGECSAQVENANGEMECAGRCEGNCTGTCELSAGGSCEGTCRGECTAEVEAMADCSGEFSCEGTCEGECQGSCEGTATPPSCTAEGECEAEADCQASASAQASADVQCTPPSLEVQYRFAADISGDATAQAEFSARMATLRANAGTMLQATTKYSALFEGENSAAVNIAAALDGLSDGIADGSLVTEVPAGKIACVQPAVNTSISTLGDLTSEATANIEAQATFAQAFATGFSGEG